MWKLQNRKEYLTDNNGGGNWKGRWLKKQKEDTMACGVWKNCWVDAALNKLIENDKPTVINPPYNFIDNNINTVIQKAITSLI